MTEHERPDDYDIPQRPIPQDKQSLLDGVSSTHKMYTTSSPQGQSSSTYAICAPSSPPCVQTRKYSHPIHPPPPPQTVPQHLPPHQPQLHQSSQYSNNQFQYPLIVQHTSQSEQCLSHPHYNSQNKGNRQSPLPPMCPNIALVSHNIVQIKNNIIQIKNNIVQINGNIISYKTISTTVYSSGKSMQNQPKSQYSQVPSIMQRSKQGPHEPPRNQQNRWCRLVLLRGDYIQSK